MPYVINWVEWQGIQGRGFRTCANPSPSSVRNPRYPPNPWVIASRWGRNVLVYGEEGLKRDHPVVRFLATQGKCRALNYYKDG